MYKFRTQPVYLAGGVMYTANIRDVYDQYKGHCKCSIPASNHLPYDLSLI